MTTIGDVLMVFGGLGVLGLCSWALLMIIAILADRSSEVSATRLKTRAGRYLLRGVLPTVVIFTIAFVCIANPLPPLKVIGSGLLISQFLMGAVGGAGAARLVANQIDAISGQTRSYRSLAVGSALIVIACGFPVIGWFFIAPLLHICGNSLAISAFLPSKVPPVADPQIGTQG